MIEDRAELTDEILDRLARRIAEGLGFLAEDYNKQTYDEVATVMAGIRDGMAAWRAIEKERAWRVTLVFE